VGRGIAGGGRARGVAETAAAAARVVELDLGATVYQLAAAHRLRVLVAGGAHPRWVRNYGTGEPWPNATRLVPVHHAVHHSPQRPSVIALPIAPALLAGDPAGR